LLAESMVADKDFRIPQSYAVDRGLPLMTR